MKAHVSNYPADADEMVAEQIVPRHIRDQQVIQAMRTVPRHLFVAPQYRGLAYTDQPLPIGHNQTISQPYIVAFMTEALRLSPQARVLEIGTGCGYQTAVLAQIAKLVFTVEIVAELARRAKATLEKQGYTNIHFNCGNGREGWSEFAPYSHIMVTAASSAIPPALLDQLENGGRLLIPLGTPNLTQELVLIEKKDDQIKKTNLLPVRFVPLVDK